MEDDVPQDNSSTLSAKPPPSPLPTPTEPERDYAELDLATLDQRYAPRRASSTQREFRHSWWAAARERTRRALIDADAPRGRQARYEQCGNSATVTIGTHTGRVKVNAICCHDRWCRACGRVRRQRLARALATRLELDQEAAGTWINHDRGRHLVLTLASRQESLGDAHRRILRNFARLRSTDLWKSAVKGGCWVFECTWSSERKQWHPHLHCIVFGSFLKQQDLAAKWHEITGDSFVVDISEIHAGRAAVREVSKYVGKIAHRSFEHVPELLAHAVTQLNGKRLEATFGSWRGTELQPCTPLADIEPVIEWGSLDHLYAAAAIGSPEAVAVLQALRTGEPVVWFSWDGPQKSRFENEENAAQPPA